VAVLVVASVAVEAMLGGSVVAVAPGSSQPVQMSELRPVILEASAAPVESPSPVPAAAEGEGTLVPSVAAAPGPTATPAPAAVVRFRPLAGQFGVVPPGQVSVRFAAAMNRSSTQSAFAVTVNGTPVGGRVSWAEGNTVLVFTPLAPIPYGAKVRLSVGSQARTASGAPLPAARTATFTVMAKPTPPPTPTPTRAPAVARPRPTPAPRPVAKAPAPTPRPVAQPAPASSGWRWPLIGPITQYFGQSLTIYGPHKGIDIDGQTGDPVVAARSGTVIAAGHVASDACGGLQVRIDNGDGLVEWYHHFSKVLVSVGQRVSAGTLIGRVGATGCAFGSHLHFAVLLHGVFVDPLRYLPKR